MNKDKQKTPQFGCTPSLPASFVYIVKDLFCEWFKMQQNIVYINFILS